MKNVFSRVWRDVVSYRYGLLFFALYYLFSHVFLHAFCPMVLMTGFPCPACGMTRAVFFLVTGQFARSWGVNPMALPFVLFAVYCFFWRYARGERVRGFGPILFFLCMGLTAGFIFRMAAIFPERPPYVYRPDNFAARFIPGYREILHLLLGI